MLVTDQGQYKLAILLLDHRDRHERPQEIIQTIYFIVLPVSRHIRHDPISVGSLGFIRFNNDFNAISHPQLTRFTQFLINKTGFPKLFLTKPLVSIFTITAYKFTKLNDTCITDITRTDDIRHNKILRVQGMSYRC